jgi:putative oxidoreductase
MQKEGMEWVPLFLTGAIVFELGGGLSLLLGLRARLGAQALIVFLIPTTLIFHDFWTYTDAREMQNQMQHFMKNLAILGGLFFVLGTGAGCCSVDRWRRARLAAIHD